MNFIWTKTLWGVNAVMGNTPEDDGYNRLFRRLVGDGFNAVETPIWLIEDIPAFVAALRANGLRFIAMINTCTPSGEGPQYQVSLEAHISSFERQVAQVKASIPADLLLLINAHSGVDSWSLETSKKYFTRALEVEAQGEILICHETHRGRVLYNPWITRDLCIAFPQLKLTADFSHFCVVAERVFGPDDSDWVDVMKTIAPAVRHIHARVGYAQGPQVPDPRAPEYLEALERHEGWWDQIISTQRAANITRMTIEPEHGTDGYQQRLPFTQVETANLWEVNKWIRDREASRMGTKQY